jgi:tetratricopeptide (TPR) repeat protein
MITNSKWIQRKVADEIYSQMLNKNNRSVVVYLIQAPPGMGKTYLARDLGTRLGSSTGYEPIHTGTYAWSGILDIYDPDTNSNPGIERRLIEALAPDSIEFEEYLAARELYQAYYKSGIAGSGLEEQRHKIEVEFAAGLRRVSATCRPTLVFDTIERLESGADPTSKTLGFFDDTASVMGWLIFQITQLENSVVLLLGREVRRFAKVLQSEIAKANASRIDAPIELKIVPLSQLDPDEVASFFENRTQRYPRLATVLSEELRTLLIERTNGNPLLIDIVLQTLLETNDRARVKNVLNNGNLEDLERDLVTHYNNSLNNSGHQTLLQLLALARNGLFAELIEALERDKAHLLKSQLADMEELPFIKVRNISFPLSKGHTVERRTYFLHDAMYAICDEVLFRPEQVKLDTQHIVDWYESEITAIEQSEGTFNNNPRYTIKASDLYVQIMFYWMRVDPVLGYQTYLRLTDWAIRSVETSLDMRLRDALGLFLSSSGQEDNVWPSQALGSKIDRENIAALDPDLLSEFELDSATLWMRRFSIRGKNDRTREIAKQLENMVAEQYEKNPDKYALSFADFLLSAGQGVMYSYQSAAALDLYQRTRSILNRHYNLEINDSDQVKSNLDDFHVWRLNSIAGRLFDNIGYTLWIYEGKYSLAVREFQHAINLFREANIPEELANSSDNMGRVYAILGYEIRSIRLIKTALQIRRDLGLVYREALSHNSLAVALAHFDRFQQALQSIDAALVKFRIAGVERGIGLGLLAHGEIMRQIAESWRDTDRPVEQVYRDIDQAESELRESLRMFSTVNEPIREVQVRNALASCYRTRLLLMKHTIPAPNQSSTDMVVTQGRILYQQAIRQAEDKGYLLEQLDSIQDLAVLFFRAGRYADAEKYLSEIKQRIPEIYQIQPTTGLAILPEEERVDAYYKLLGQVEQLLGAIAFDNGFHIGSIVKPRARQTLGPDPIEAMLHYLLGVTYFSQYSDKSFVHRQVYSRIIRRYQDFKSKDVNELLSVHIPDWIHTYNLPREFIYDILADVFGV